MRAKFLLDGLMEIAEYDGPTDALLLRYVYGPGMTAPLAEVSAAGNKRFLHTDAIGSVVAVTGDGSSGGGLVDPQVLNQTTGTPQGSGDLTVPGFVVPAGDDRVLLVSVDSEVSTIDGVTFGGAAMTQVGQVVNGQNVVALYELREAGLGLGAQSGDLVVGLSDTTAGGAQVRAWTLTGIDQSASAVVSEAFNGGTGQTTVSASITTSAASSIVVSAFGLGDPVTWVPGAGETQIGYDISAGRAAGGASYELIGAGTHDLSWSGPAAGRPTLLLAAYATEGGGGGGLVDPQVLNQATGTPQGSGDLTVPGFVVPAGDDRVLLVSVDSEVSTINGVTFGGAAMTQVGQVVNGQNVVALYELREAGLGLGAQSGDLVVGLSDTTAGGAQVTAWTLTGIDQSASAVVSEAFNGGTGQTTVSASITTSAASSIVVSAFGLGDPVTWVPGAGETQIGYDISAGRAAGGASYELVGAGTHDLSWSGSLAQRPTLLLAAYAAAPIGGGFAINNPQSGSGSLPGYTVGLGSDRVLLVGVATNTILNTSMDVRFGGTPISQLQSLNNNSLRTALFQLPEAALGAGTVTGDITVSVNGSTPSTTEIVAYYLTGVDQNELARRQNANTVFINDASSITGFVSTNAPNTVVVSAFSVNVTDTWTPGADETTILYNVSGGNTVAASYEVAPTSGTSVSMNWTGPAAARPTIIAVTYGLLAPAGSAGGGGFATPAVQGAQTAASLGEDDVNLAGFTAPAGENRVLLVAVDNEDGTIEGVTFGGQALSQVGLVANGLNDVALYELREAALGAGAQSGDILVQVTGASHDGKATQAVAFTVAGLDQAAAPVLSQATSLGTAETSITAGITTTAAKSLLVSAFGLGDQVTWAPGAGEIQAGYAGSGSAAGGASTEVVGSGSQDMSWSGPAAGRPTLLLTAYAAAPASGGGSPGNVAERYAYGPHGEGLDAGLGTIAFRYAGHRYDAETGLIYMRARYYSVAIGRFLSPDPIGYADGFNLYTYAANSPLNFIDPTGLAGQFAAQGFEGLTPLSRAELASMNPRDEAIRQALAANLAEWIGGGATIGAVVGALVGAVVGTGGAVACAAGTGGGCLLGAPAIIAGGTAGGAKGGGAIGAGVGSVVAITIYTMKELQKFFHRNDNRTMGQIELYNLVNRTTGVIDKIGVHDLEIGRPRYLQSYLQAENVRYVPIQQFESRLQARAQETFDLTVYFFLAWAPAAIE